MNLTEIWAIIVAIFTILAAFAFLAWINSDAYNRAINNPSPENIKGAFMSSPPIREATTIADACNDGMNLNCTTNIAIKVLEKKAEDSSKE